MADENKNAIETDPKLKKQDNEKKTDVEKDLETNCTICAILINDYKPKYFLNIEKNPACDDCCDSTDDEDANYEHGEEEFKVKQEAQSEEHSSMVATKLQASKGDLERKNEEEIQKMKWKNLCQNSRLNLSKTWKKNRSYLIDYLKPSQHITARGECVIILFDGFM